MNNIIRVCIAVIMASMFSACVDHDDFAFTGTVVDYEQCTSITEMGYAIALSSPDTIGGDYETRKHETFHNVVVVYGADRMLHANDNVSGRIYLDPNYSKTQCSYHYTDRDVPEAVFTKLEVTD